MDEARSVVAFCIPVIICLFLTSNRSYKHQNVAICTIGLLSVSFLLSIVILRINRLEQLPQLLTWFISPIRHADYLHLCLNILGGYLVIRKLEGCAGWRPTLLVIAAAYLVQIIVIGFLSFVLKLQLDIIGISFIVFTAIGFVINDSLANITKTGIYTFETSLVLSTIIEPSIRTVIVHLVGVLIGFSLSHVLNRVR